MARLGGSSLGTATLGSDDKTISLTSSNATASSPEPNVQPGEATMSVPKSTATASNPTPTITSVTTVNVTESTATASNPQPQLNPGPVTTNIPETAATTSTPEPNVTGGPVEVSILESDATAASPQPAVNPGPATISVPVSSATAGNPALSTFKVANIVSPTKAIITTRNKFVDMADHTFKEGDLGDELTADLKDDNGAVDLTQVNKVELVMQDRNRETVLDERVNITDASNGKVDYRWTGNDTPINNPGVYRAEFRVTDNAGDTETVPNDGYVVIEIEEELG